MKKLFLAMLAIGTVIGLAACNNNNDDNDIQDNVNGDNEVSDYGVEFFDDESFFEFEYLPELAPSPYDEDEIEE